jgi:hypothetical protein
MGRIKHWNLDEVWEISEYLRSTVGVESLIKLRDNKGTRTKSNTTLSSEIQTVIDALAWSVRKVNDDPELVNQAFETWISDYLVEGAREKLLNALRVRQHRQEAAEKALAEKEERGEEAELDAAVTKLVKRYGLVKVFESLNRVFPPLKF